MSSIFKRASLPIVTRLSLLSTAVLVLLTAAVLLIGDLVLTSIVRQQGSQILRLELAQAIPRIAAQLERSGVRAAARESERLQAELMSHKGYRSAKLFVVEDVGDRVIYHPDQPFGARLDDGLEQLVKDTVDDTIEFSTDNETRFAVVDTLRPIDWIVGISIDLQEMTAPKYDFLLWIGSATLGVLCLSVLMFNLFGRELINRLDATRACVEEITRGNLDARLDTLGNSDEIADLQAGINTMGDNIKRRTLEAADANREIRQLNEQLEQKVRERTSELRVANRELESFCYAVSHDLRAPVRAISGFQGALREDYASCLPDEGIEFLDEIQTGALHMNALIDGLLQLSRSSRGKLESSDVDLARMARELCDRLCHNDSADRVELRTEGDLQVTGDPRLLGTLMQNLIENAWKYRLPDSTAEITVQREAFDDMDCICVHNTGVGFDPAFAHKLFEPFQRLHADAEFHGLGIGLATCARIVQRHGGDIAGCGRPGEGARFCFTLQKPGDGKA